MRRSRMYALFQSPDKYSIARSFSSLPLSLKPSGHERLSAVQDPGLHELELVGDRLHLHNISIRRLGSVAKHPLLETHCAVHFRRRDRLGLVLGQISQEADWNISRARCLKEGSSRTLGCH